MRHAFRWFIVFVMPMILSAETPLSPAGFAKLSLEDAAKAIDAAKSNYLLLTDYAAASIESKRFDLAAVCFEDPRMDGWFAQAVSKLPDSPYKEELMLMMLKSGSPFWDRLRYISRYPGHLNIDKTSTPFRAFIEKYLPTIRLDDSLFSTREGRSMVAVQIEEVRNAKPQTHREAAQPNATPPPPDTQQSKSSTPVPTATPAPVLPSPTGIESPAPVAERKALVWPWLVGIVALLLIVAVALKRRA